MSRELAIFKGKENLKRYRERPLTAVRNALSEEFGVMMEAGKRLSCTPHWPDFFLRIGP